ncbi:DNA-directed DNA polymerase, family A, palm domain containing protein [uncultured Caudovirales phage]|uniref:DNA-directed DNA polymerase, family A, palm domain containing protein n=1 Tax=uncultured Caudovirales phage TaxID=2100421 RepID=A0A6J5RE48_9CAUD|nr:DNA-directed DNA polymerase, family A, palm domain containing protein [uncultured Caudovirales phage]
MTIIKAHLDFETASPQPLGKQDSVGVHRYEEDPATRIWGFCWSLGGQVFQWRPGYPDPQPLLDHVSRGGIVVAHNAAFERIIWNNVLLRDYAPHWPKLTIQQQDCTMSRASASGLPAGLDQLGTVLGTNQRKDKKGHALMIKMSKPRGRNPDGSYTWRDSPDMVEGLMAYCEQDVRTEAEIDGLLPPLSENERQVWILDQVINDRGVAVDVTVCKRAESLVALVKRSADKEMRRITNYEVGGVSKVLDLSSWIKKQGVECPSLASGELDGILASADRLGVPKVREAVELRREASKTSTAKYHKINKCVTRDGRLRGLLAYWGAKPGRWAGRLVQPQNFPRFDREEVLDTLVIEGLMRSLGDSGIPLEDIIEDTRMMAGSVLPWLAKMLRGTLVAGVGNKFYGGDFSGIEGRVNAFLAGEDWKNKAFLDYDKGEGPDLYKVTAASILGKTAKEVGRDERQSHGKVPELACGYQGGVNAFLNMGANYGVDPVQIADVVERLLPPQKWDGIAKRYKKATDKSGLQEREWTAIKSVVEGWREANPNITQSWWDYQNAALYAVDNINEISPVREGRIPVRFLSDGSYLYCCLPSGRILCYASPRVEEETVIRVNKKGEEFNALDRKLSCWGVDSITRSWKKQYIYGGRICENICQGTARDIMVYAMFNMEAEGYPLVLTVHDELLSETPLGFGSVKHYEEIMSRVPPWAKGMPLAAKTWEDVRYVK